MANKSTAMNMEKAIISNINSDKPEKTVRKFSKAY